MDLLVGVIAGFLVAVVTTPAGVSGAVLLLPVQVGLLGVPSPAVSPTNLVFNVVSTPGGVLRLWRQGTVDRALARVLVVGCVPGVVLGAVIRVHLVADDRAFLAVVGAVLVPLGVWLALVRAPAGGESRREVPRWLLPAAVVVGTVGGVYGVGGGSLLAPLLLATGFAARQVAGAALVSTLITSVAGILAYEVLARTAPGPAPVGPEWSLGVALGLGGLAGSYLGARLQPRLPERLLRRLLGVTAVLAGLRAWSSWLG